MLLVILMHNVHALYIRLLNIASIICDVAKVSKPALLHGDMEWKGVKIHLDHLDHLEQQNVDIRTFCT